jgi:DNA polymerase I-like protein with 3'-5' exonuclease and polymerase domains
MPNIAIVEKYPSKYRYESLFPFEFDKYALVEEKADKILKRDVTLDMDAVKEVYDFVILIGKESCKYVADIRSVTEFQGYLVEDKYLALLSPIAVKLQPSKKDSFDKAVNDIIKYVSGEYTSTSNININGIQNQEEAEKYLDDLYEKAVNSEILTLSMDTETSALYPRDGFLLGISIATSSEDGVYIDALCLDDDLLETLQKIIDRVTVLFFNGKFDKKWLTYHCGLSFPKWEDVMLEHYDLDENDSHGLKGLAIKFTELGDYDRDLEEYKADYCKQHGVKKANFTYDLIPFDIIYKYAALDAIATYRLHYKFKPYVENNENLLNVYNTLLIKGSDALQQFEENGVPLTLKENLHKYIEDINDKINELNKSLYDFDEVKKVEEIKGALFNVNSTQHVSCLLFEQLLLPVLKLTDTGNPSADAEVLNNLSKEHPIASIINNIKKLKKIKATYLDKFYQGMDMDGRLRTNFNLHTTTSGRLSSSGKFNAQQLPRGEKGDLEYYLKLPKKAIEARPNYKIISQDLKTAEMYVASVLSGDKNLQEVFVTGVDYHGFMATHKFGIDCHPNEVAKLYPEKRQEAKTVSFEILYKLNYREPVLENFPQLKRWLKKQESFIKQKGFIYSYFGRKRRLSDVFSPDKKSAQHEVRSGINFLVQSVSSDINLLASIEMQNWIVQNNYQEYMLIFGLVHDSILAEVHDDYISIYCEKLRELTQKDRGLSIPNCPIGIDLEIGQNYAFI